MSVFESGWRRQAAVVCLSLTSSTALTVALKPVLHTKARLLPFTLAVIVASSYGGLAAGLITTALSFVIGDFFFVEPLYQILTTPDDYALLLVFLLFGVSLSIVNHQLAKANLAVVERSRQLARSNEELQRFAHSTAHDLQEPLRGIRMFAELFLQRNRGHVDAESARLLDVVVESARRMKNLIEAILEFSVAGQPGDASPVDTGTVVDAAIRDLRGAIDESGAEVRVETLPSVVANDKQLGRVFLNLIGNAIKYRDERTPLQITISAKSLPQEWAFSVKDNGIGVGAAHRDRIFETFQRVNGRASEGHGLGLATCKRIVEQQGGRIWVEPAPGHGADFRFTLPKRE